MYPVCVAPWKTSLRIISPPGFGRTPREGLYVPPDDLIRGFLRDSRTAPAFFVPLFVYNVGARHGEIGSVLMIAELTSNRTCKWAYAAYFELDESKLIHIDQRMRDLDKLSAFFPGRTIAPNDSTKLNLYFMLHHNVLGVKISTVLASSPGRVIRALPAWIRRVAERLAPW